MRLCATSAAQSPKRLGDRHKSGGNIAPSKELILALVNLVLFGVMISLYAMKEGSPWGVCAYFGATGAFAAARACSATFSETGV